MIKTKSIHLTIPGNPVPQGRPRGYRRGKHIGFYDDPKSKDWKKTVAVHAVTQLKYIDSYELIQTAIKLQIVFKILRPKSVSVKKRPEPICRPDLDNLIKAVKDALNGVLWRDDSQIIELEATKIYSDPPGVSIEVWF